MERAIVVLLVASIVANVLGQTGNPYCTQHEDCADYPCCGLSLQPTAQFSCDDLCEMPWMFGRCYACDMNVYQAAQQAWHNCNSGEK